MNIQINVPDFGVAANWVSLYDNFTASLSGDPISPIILPNSVTSRFLRVAANNQDAKDSWRLGGYCLLMVDEPNPEVIVSRIYSPVNAPIILMIPDYLASYRVIFQPPKWFDEISLQIDGYIGQL